MSSLFLAAAPESTGINSVSADLIKSLLILAGFLITTWAAYRQGKKNSGSRDEPVHLAQPVEVKAHVEFAVKHDTERRFVAIEQAQNELRTDFDKQIKEVCQVMDAHRREALRESDQISKQIGQVMQAGAERENKVLKAIHESENRLSTATLKELKDIHQRVNPLAQDLASVKTAMEIMQKQGSRRA